MGTFGQRLKREREMRGVSLDEIAQATKIGTRSLRALEEEDFDRLPGGIFNKGFVRAYARFLGIDEEQAVADYLIASGLEAAPAEVEETEASASSEDLWRRRSLAIAITALLLGALGYAGWWLYSTGWLTPKPARQETRLGSSSAVLPGPASTQVAGSQAKPPENPPPVAAPAAAVAEDFTVRLRGHGECWVEITADGRREEVTLAAGGEKEVRAREKIEVKLGDVSAVEVSFNGEALPPLSGEPKVRKLTFTREGLQR
ncbi:MAG: helix-turn-helix domain-containing protein [Terriglobales bacterium]